MSQKSTRRSRRRTADEDATPLKAPTPKPVEEVVPIAEEVEPPPATPEPPAEEASNEKPDDAENGVVTRSRSTTPQVKKLANGHEDAKNEEPDLSEKEEMDPLVITDEADPELVFEEGSEEGSGRSSPANVRCTTRRSEFRNIPTPKTPNAVEQHEEEVEREDAEDGEHELEATFESCSDNVSTKAEAGGDSTRLEYMEMSTFESNSFLQGNKNKSFGEALKHLSTRRTIRPISGDFRRRVLETNVNRNAASTSSYPTRSSIERLSVGRKRKGSSEEDECRKRIKRDSPGFFSIFTSPLTSIRNPFRADLASSTPKLTGYKDDKFLIEDEAGNPNLCQVDGERRWCSIM